MSSPLLSMWQNRYEQHCKKAAFNIFLTCQYHSAQQRTAEQQHCQLYIYTASFCLLREKH